MPELPEVETIRRQLAPCLVGRRLVKTEARLPRRTFPDVTTFVQETQGRRVEAVCRHGKQMYLHLEGDVYLLIHLGMTGRLAIEGGPQSEKNPAWAAHRHGLFTLDDGHLLVFTDPRTFGSMAVSPDKSFLSRMGPDPLTDDFAPSSLVARLQKTQSQIKSALLNQAWIAGLGNIYADEVLFLGRVHPAASAMQVSRNRLRTVVSHIRPVLERAIEAAGATLKDGGYQDLFGQHGHYYPYVYGNTGQPCQVCGTAVQRGTLGPGKSARSYHFCPRCQKK